MIENNATPTSAKDRPKIVVDADACPVKAEIISVAGRFRVPVLMVASYDHKLPEVPGIETVQVDRSDQSADLYIANRIREGDILVTQDFGLATIGLARKATVLSNRGHCFTEQTIDFLLEQRHGLAKARKHGRYGKGPKPFTEEDRSRFLHTLTKILSSMQDKWV